MQTDESIQITRIAEAIETIEEAADSHSEVKEAVEDNVIKEAAEDGVVKEVAPGDVVVVKEAVQTAAEVKEAVRQLSNNQSFVQKVRGDHRDR